MSKWIKKRNADGISVSIWQLIEKENIKEGSYGVMKAYEKYGDSIFPIAMNSFGGWHHVDLDDEDVIEVFESDEEPTLNLEEIYPKNFPGITYGWLSPELDTYSCDFMEHWSCAKFICNTFDYEDSGATIPDEVLLNRGWIKLDGKTWFGLFDKITDKQLLWVLDTGRVEESYGINSVQELKEFQEWHNKWNKNYDAKKMNDI